VLLAVVKYVYTGDLVVDHPPTHHNNICTLVGDLLGAESLLGLEDAGLRTRLEDLLLRELAREGAGGQLDSVLVFWNLGVLHELPRLLEAVFSLLDLRLESYVLEAAGGRGHIAQLGFEVRCVLQWTIVYLLHCEEKYCDRTDHDHYKMYGMVPVPFYTTLQVFRCCL